MKTTTTLTSLLQRVWRGAACVVADALIELGQLPRGAHAPESPAVSPATNGWTDGKHTQSALQRQKHNELWLNTSPCRALAY
ncbi:MULTISPECIES: hypothetical protein [Hallella]|uniref:Secreted protein n=1 Tax=Hallella faecis TaxID=2841596 RepID=A0ABV1FM66_9BACT|nr:MULTISPECIES: hypothetical protein [Hallella]MCI7434778.1 hypothetical protein [Prevotella sp.]MBU0289181.1 hypothetical protein [Hallella faecis]MDD7146063.1 hypothetical protein [Hallella sp.]MDR3844037.1 hypothetical protein [Hallella sp.]MDY5924476.1 hypothetical protein [Hallella sp.]